MNASPNNPVTDAHIIYGLVSMSILLTMPHIVDHCLK
ncbi:unnamed protein product [Schistosoma curassoni]|uniref:Transposase n=1 Tax=Schistosoma curassoni TaxID=6186 RepID=A0A183KPL6_9TREM|nr:unnamed protein product [Schistosoma curassoni]